VYLAFAIACILALSTLSQISTAQLGTGEGFGVFITYDEDEYWIGDEVDLTIHVLYEGRYRDPDELEMRIGYWSDRSFTATRTGTGKYAASVVIKEEDLWRGFEYVLWADAELTDASGTWLSNDRVDIPLRGTHIYTRVYPVDPSHAVPSPGDHVDYIIEVFDDTDLTDADENYPQVSSSKTDLEIYPVVATRIGTGRYTFSHNISDELTENQDYWIRVNVAKTVGPITRYADAEIDIIIDALKVWCRITNITSGSADVELVVMDVNGTGLADSTVELIWSYWRDDDYPFENGTWTTDDRGHLNVTLDTPATELNHVNLRGKVHALGLTQAFFGYYDLDFISEPLPGLRSYEDYESPMSPGQKHVVHHTIVLDGEPVVREEVFVYYENDRTILFHGTVVTDSQGQFSVTLDLPEGMAPVDPRTEGVITGHLETLDTLLDVELVWYRPPSRNLEDFTPVQNEDVLLEVGDIQPGQQVSVQLDHPDADGDLESAIVYWSPVSDDPWNLWNQEALEGHDRVQCTWTGDGYEASFVPPTFVTEDVRIEVVGVIRFNDREEDIVVSRIVTIPDQPPPTDEWPPVIGEVPDQSFVVNTVKIIDLSPYITDQDTLGEALTLSSPQAEVFEVLGLEMAVVFEEVPDEDFSINFTVSDGVHEANGSFDVLVREADSDPQDRWYGSNAGLLVVIVIVVIVVVGAAFVIRRRERLE
jgi:hypothetical protein